jgi:reductive dehalogenase
VAPQKYKFKDPEEASSKVKRAARFLGASLVGIAEYNPLWTYSHLVKARFDRKNTNRDSPRYDLIAPQFPFEPKSVVVIAIEMDYKGISLSPSSIESAATGLGYSQMSAIGYSVATFIRRLGYKSFACGNDVSLSIPYAVAAGLGELGRNGLLITWEFGPRVRLVKVFTELEMKPDKPKTYGIWDFCKSCKRCAETCPSNAVSLDEPTFQGPTISNNPGVLKWYVNPEKCYQFWRENGSDCADCITACPFNKPKMWHHRLSAAFTILPVAPLHSLMAKMDRIFGFGDTHNRKEIAEFWDES